jgi:flagellar biosynthesis protein FlhA
MLKDKMSLLKMDQTFAGRYLNEGFSGGEKKRNEILQMAALKPEIAILDETDSGLDIDALRIVSEGVNALMHEELGVLIPAVHLRDDLRLEPSEYRVLLRGNEIGRGVAHVDRLMALDPAGGTPAIDGFPAKEPAFGLPAVWIAGTERASAEARGLTLVDPASVVTTHLSELLRRNAHDLLGRQEAQELLAVCAKEAPKLVEDVVPAVLSLGDLVRVLRGLLREGVSVRDLRSILEAVADGATRSKDTGFLVEQARRRLSRQVTAKLADASGVVHALTLDRLVEDALRASLGVADGEPAVAPDIDTARKILASLERGAAALASAGRPTVLLAAPDLRRPLFDFASRFVPDLQVVSARELVPGTTIEPAGSVQILPTGRG